MLIWKLVTRTDSLNFTHFLTVHVVVCNLRKPITVLLITVFRMLRKTVLGKTCPADFCFLLIAHRSPKLWVSRSSFKPSFFERGLKSSSDEREWTIRVNSDNRGRSKQRKSAGKAEISSTSLACNRFAFANEQEANWKSAGKAKISRTSLAYYRFANANDWARSKNQQEKRKSAGQVLPVTVLRSHMSNKRKSAGRVLIAYYRFAY